jgi:hypothetical protein
MIQQVSNNKPSGFSSKECDSGIPVSGRTADNGTYQILKLLPNGISANQFPIATQYVGLPQIVFGVAPATVTAGRYLGILPSILTIPQRGVYDIEPYVQLNCTGTPIIDIIMTSVSSGLTTYASTIVAGTDPFSPTFTDFALVDSGFIFDDVPLLPVSATNDIQRSDLQSGQRAGKYHKFFMEPGDYAFILVARNGFTILSPQTLAGFNFINQYA